jgi:Centromere DNA-binding protein complex CBF3 subunit, domain 2
VLPRAGYEPPASLQLQIWPWLDGWLSRVKAQAQGKGWKAGGLAQDDKAAESFLNLLQLLRTVLLQDLAVLQPSKCLIH